MRRTKKNIMLIFILFCINNLNAQNVLTKKQMYEDFDQLIEIISDCNPQIPIRAKVTGFDNLKFAKSLRHNIDTITDGNSYFNLLHYVLRSMYDIHAYIADSYHIGVDDLINIDTNYIVRPLFSAFSIRSFLGNPTYIDGSYYFFNENWIIDYKAKDTIRLKDAKILTYNGKEFSKFVKETQYTFNQLNARWDYKKKEYYSVYALVPFSGILTLENQGKIATIDLNKSYQILINYKSTHVEKPNIAVNNYFETFKNKVFYFDKDKILYIRLGSMMDDKKEFYDQIKKVGQNNEIKKIIIDVRNNKGGSDYVWHQTLSAIIKDSILYQPTLAFVNSSNIKKIYNNSDNGVTTKSFKLKTFDWCPDFQFLVSEFPPSYIVPDSNSLEYDGKIYILQNKYVYSSAHALTSFARYCDQLISIGEPTGLLSGLGLMPTLFQLQNSKFTFRLETAIDVTDVKNIEDVYQDIPEIWIEIPIEKQIEWEKDSYYNQQSEEYLFKYDYLFQQVLKY